MLFIKYNRFVCRSNQHKIIWSSAFLLSFMGQVLGQIPQKSAYFQQEVNYTIRVRLDDHKHILHGYEEFEYTNHAPHNLNELYIHLWPNAYSSKQSAFAQQQLENNSLRFHFAKPAQMGKIDSLEFKVNGQKVKWEFIAVDIARVELAQPLLPGATLKFSTPFRVKVPHSFSRLGHIEQQYQITQWYPKPAVYDRAGWHPIPYLDQGEFYSEFGSFDVTIEVPKNYVVGATGDLQNNPEEESWLIEREKISRKLLSEPKQKTNKVFEEKFKNNEYKKLRFFQKNIHDFAWFADKQYYVLTDSIELPNSKRKIKTVALFNESQKKYWQDAPKYVGEGIYYYSKWVGEYPYNHCTAVDGALSAGGGMEYPNITVVSAGGSKSSLQEVIVHEVGHNWFYGILASNERRFPWMDEGWNSFYEHRTIDLVSVDLKADGKRHYGFGGFGIPLPFQNSSQPLCWAYKLSQSLNVVQPIEYPSEQYKDLNYGLVVYVKSVLALRYLEAYLGRTIFDRCMQTYFERWKFKHPYPADLQAVFEEVSEKKLDWFFESYLNTANDVDFSIENVLDNKEALWVSASNTTGVPLCAELISVNAQGDTLSRLWTEPFMGTGIFKLEKKGGWHRVEINPGERLPERHIHNNNYYNRSLFASWEKPKVGFIYGLENPRQRKAFILPTLGSNTTNGFMLGALLHYQFFPKKNFEFHVMPMLAFRGTSLVGSAGATYHFFPKKVFRKIDIHSRTALFADLLRTKNFVEFYFRPPHARQNITNIVTLRSHHLAVHDKVSSELRSIDNFKPTYAALDWNFYYNKTAFGYGVDFEVGLRDADAVRLSIAPKLLVHYAKKGEIQARAFAGTFLRNEAVGYPLQFRLSGSYDPFGEQIYFDRNGRSSVLSNQIFEDQGGFRTILPVSTNQWLTTANINVRAPERTFGLFADFGAAGNSVAMGNRFDDQARTFYDAGLSLHLLGDVLNIYFPIVGSVFPDEVPHSWQNFRENISFSVQVNNLIKRIPYFEK